VKCEDDKCGVNAKEKKENSLFLKYLTHSKASNGLEMFSTWELLFVE
jgi:hypothetical protein